MNQAIIAPLKLLEKRLTERRSYHLIYGLKAYWIRNITMCILMILFM